MNVMIRRAEAGAEFLRRDPLVVIRGGRVLLLAKQGGERGVLLGSALQAEHHVVHGQAIGCEAAIEFRAGERMNVCRDASTIWLSLTGAVTSERAWLVCAGVESTPTEMKAKSTNNLVVRVCGYRMVFMSISDAPKGQIRWLLVASKT